MPHFIFLLCIGGALISPYVVASPFLIGIAGVGTEQNSLNKHKTYQFGAGYDLNDTWSTMLAASQISDHELGAEGVLRYHLPLSQNTKIFIDAGLYQQASSRYVIGGGLQFDVMSNLQLLFSYRGYQSLNDQQGEIVNFTVGAKYRFNFTKSDTVTTTIVQELNEIARASHVIFQNEVSSPVQLEQKDKQLLIEKCIEQWVHYSQLSSSKFKLTPYVVKKGDWLMKIAREHCIRFDLFLSLNPEFINRTKKGDFIYPGDLLAVPQKEFVVEEQ